MKDIPGIEIVAFKLSELHLKCNITLTFSDAKELSNRTFVDLPANPKFREIFFDKFSDELRKVIKQKESKVNNAN